MSAFNAGCAMSCATALAEGVLVAEGSSLALRATTGETNAIAWDSGTWVRKEGGKLALVDWLGSVKAREGDHIQVAGGVPNDGIFHACGPIAVVSP